MADIVVIREPSVITVSGSGVAGPVGPGASAESHTHTQALPSTTWTVTPPWTARLPVSITVYVDRAGVLIESSDSVITTMISNGPSFTVDFGSVPESGKVIVL